MIRFWNFQSFFDKDISIEKDIWILRRKRNCNQTLKKGSWNWKDFLLTNCDVTNISIPTIQSTLINIFVWKLILHFTTKLFPLVKQKSSNMVSECCWGLSEIEFETIIGCAESIKWFSFCIFKFLIVWHNANEQYFSHENTLHF